MESKLTEQQDLFRQFQEGFGCKTYPFRQVKNKAGRFDTSDWIKIKIKHDQTHPNLLAFIIAVNEIFRFEIGHTQPEICMSETHLYSRRVPQDDSVGEYQIRTLYHDWNKMISENNLFWEGMGRVVFNKYLYQDNDFNIYNVVIDKNQYFVGLDPETCFWPIVEKYHRGKKNKPSDVKVIVYNNTPFPARMSMTSSGRPVYVIQDKRRAFIGQLHEEDYHALPELKHHYPTHWFFHTPELRSYTRALASDLRFNNEKHFSALKAIITACIKRWLLGLHIRNSQDRQDAIKYVSSQIRILTDICVKSNAFTQYIKDHRLTAVQTIVYEISRFIKQDDIYVLDDAGFQADFQNSLYQMVVFSYAQLLERLNDPLTPCETDKLHDICAGMDRNRKEMMTGIQHFYQSQLMTYHALRIKNETEQDSPS
ncbi:hypothetical protein AQUSIP_07870 [Aquicella siphonis]|uniref:Uncharacterized protein n=1 Tax=Aquicella siphonis TaxID=254247 RepID=A0A5E4PGC2_9COXI|nr:hypothetical protein [Aquicella siphonis]VVC75497.1 hypothetical protein AQUSIP_07870 [Aquicella siphonis]